MKRNTLLRNCALFGVFVLATLQGASADIYRPSNVTAYVPNANIATSTSNVTVYLSWINNSTTFANYSFGVYYGSTSTLPTPLYRVSSNTYATTTVITGLQASSSVPMYIGMKAYNATSTTIAAFSNPFVGGTVPTTPSNVSATAPVQATGMNIPVTVTWTDNSSNETGFYVKAYYQGGAQVYSSNISPFAMLVPANTTSLTTSTSTNFVMSNIPATTTPIYFTVTATNAYGKSGVATGVSKSFVAVPTTPSNVSATAPVQATGMNIPVTVTWTDNSSNETGFYVKAYYQGGAQVYSSNISPFAMLVPANTTSLTTSTSTNFVMSNIPATTTPIYFTVTATNAYGKSGVANSQVKSLLPVTALSAPTGVFATLVSTSGVAGNHVLISWDKNPLATSYVVQRRIPGNSTVGFRAFTLNGNTSTLSDFTATKGNTYVYSVKSGNGGIVSLPTDSNPVILP